MTINTTKMYDNVMHKFKWGGVEKPGIYIEETTMRMLKSQRSAIFASLADALVNENKLDSALKVLDRCVEVIPEENVPYDLNAMGIMTLYYALGRRESGQQIATSLINNMLINIDWMLRLRPLQRETVLPLLNDNMRYLSMILGHIGQYDNEFIQPFRERFNIYYNKYKSYYDTRSE